MGRINENQEYDIEISSIYSEIMAYNETDTFSEEAYFSLQWEIEKIYKNPKFEQTVKAIKFDAPRFFYFLGMYKRWSKCSNDVKAKFRLGYFMEIHRFEENEEKEWDIEILPILNNANSPSGENYSTYQKLKKGFFLKNEIEDAKMFAYDIYPFSHRHIVLTYNKNDPEERNSFAFFFTWVLAVIELMQIDDFLKYQLAENFNNNMNEYCRFLDKVLTANQNEILDDKKIRIINEWIKSNPYTIQINPIENTNLKSLDKPKKLGRTPSEKIEIPIPPLRRPNDKKTIFNKADTGLIFSYLAQLNVILNDEKGISKDSLTKAIQCLTGFSANKIEDNLIYEGSKKPVTIEQKKKMANEIKLLIIKSLSD